MAKKQSFIHKQPSLSLKKPDSTANSPVSAATRTPLTHKKSFKFDDSNYNLVLTQQYEDSDEGEGSEDDGVNNGDKKKVCVCCVMLCG